MNRLRIFAALLCAGATTACEKNAAQDITTPAEGTFIRFANMAVNSPGVYFYTNDTKVAGLSASTCTPPTNPTCTTTGLESTTGFGYGAFGVTSGNYASLTPGSYTITSRIAASTDNGLTISSATSNLESGKSYTFYMSGFYNTTTKNAENFIVEDPIPAEFDYSSVSVRFVNAISNSSPMTLYAKNTVSLAEVPLGTAVAYKSAGTFVKLPAGVYDLAARTTGSSANAIARTAVSFVGGRVYTVTARGDITVTSTTAATRPQLDNTANR
jgi:hypothetical protein